MKSHSLFPIQSFPQGTTHAVLDYGLLGMAVRNDAGVPLAADGELIPLSTDATGQLRVAATFTPLPLTVILPEYHDCAAVQINDNAGAFVAVGSGVAFPSGTVRVHASAAFGEPLDFRLGANAAAAAAASTLFFMNRGEQNVEMTLVIPTGSKIWVRSCTTVFVDDGILTMNFIG